MTGIIREDVLTTNFGSTWSRATNKINDTSAERTCQSKCDIFKWKRNDEKTVT